ncbi:MAG TPA: DUF4384 domain-containing protein [Candidatus Krumholzibacterium sp.]|nr:DUF4384 domain-containing protein [Candidatus Krumholzibacterium sp.]
MSRKLILFLLAVILVPFGISHASPVEITRSVTWHDSGLRSDIDLSLRLIGGKGSVFGQGRDINLTFQVDRDAYVIIYNIDSEGVVQLLYPVDGVPRLARKGKVYFLPEQGKGINWEVAGKTGIEYIQALAVEDAERIDREELRFLAGNYDAPEDRQLRVDMDPLLAFNLLNEDIVRDSDEVPISTDFTYFYINREVDYPRYLCDRCHDSADIADPYAMDCPEIYIEEMLHDEDDLHYPYPAQFAVKHVDEEEGGYYVSSDYADNITSGWDDEDYYDDADSDVYLSIYYTDYNYPYRFDYPGWRSWYYANYDPWYWNYGPYDWTFSFTWGWNDYYYHHWPFHSYYSHYYYAYNWGCVYGWNPHYYHWNHHDYWYDNYHHHDNYIPRDKRGVYAGRSFQKRSLNYAVASTRAARDESIKKSRLADARTRDARKRVDPSKVRDGSYVRGGSALTSGGSRTTGSTANTRAIPSRVIYGGAGSRTGSDRRTGDSRTVLPTTSGSNRRLVGDEGRSTSTTTRSRTWGRKRSDEARSDSGERTSRNTLRTRRTKSTERDSSADKGTSTRRSEPIRSRKSETGSRSNSSSKSSTRKSGSSREKSSSTIRKSSSGTKSSSTRSENTSRKSPPAKSSSSTSSGSSNRSSSGSSRSSSKSSSSGKRR